MEARETALLTLYDVFYKGAYSNLALSAELGRAGLSRADSALATGLVYGTVSRHFTLEHIIRKYSKVRLKKLDKYIKLILELGLYQLIYTDRIPESAAVNESVKLAKRYGRRGSDGFVNAVLRSFCRDGKRIEYPKKGTAEYLSVKYSYAPETAEMFLNTFGERAESIMASLNGTPPLLLRANILKTDAEKLAERLRAEGISAEVYEGALVKADGFDIAKSGLFKDGYFTVQDLGAYTASAVLAPQPGERVLDMCAAPGGKTTHIAELMGDEGSVTACDIHEHKVRLIRENAKRLGLRSVKAELKDASVTDAGMRESFDRVLCDVPCSGLGIIRRKPDIKLGAQDHGSLMRLQSRILENGALYLKPGGTLVYSTCTIYPGENGGVTGAFLESHPGYKRTYEKTFYPDTDGSDGFYICKIEKQV